METIATIQTRADKGSDQSSGRGWAWKMGGELERCQWTEPLRAGMTGREGE